jgi:hypothetical protein
MHCLLFLLLVKTPSKELSGTTMLTVLRYLPKERAFRLGILFSANSLGVAASGLLAIAIDNVRHFSSFKQSYKPNTGV